MLRRREFFCMGVGLLFSFDVCGAEPVKGKIVQDKATWNAEQKRGRRRLNRFFDRADVPEKHRDAVFEGMVLAAREGKRGRELLDRTKEWCIKQYPDTAKDIDWDKWLKILQWIGAILAILFLFI